MSTKSNTMENGKKITKHDLLTLFFRCFLLPACYSMDRMQAPGFAYSMIPVLKKLYGDNKEKFSQAFPATPRFTTIPLPARPLCWASRPPWRRKRLQRGI